MRTIISTVGTSLLKCSGANSPTLAELLHFLSSEDPKRACAETNSLWHLLKKEDESYFLHSDTEEGELCARALVEYYKKQGYASRCEVIPRLSYREDTFRLQGLRSLVSKLVEVIQEIRKGGRKPLINATGGFKAEAAYATLVGILFDVPVYYIHEAFHKIVEMPAIPIDWDYSLLAEYEEFFEFLHQDCRTRQEVDRRLPTIPAKIRSLLTEEENFVMLSPVGEAFFLAYHAKLEEVLQSRFYSLRKHSGGSKRRTIPFKNRLSGC